MKVVSNKGLVKSISLNELKDLEIKAKLSKDRLNSMRNWLKLNILSDPEFETELEKFIAKEKIEEPYVCPQSITHMNKICDVDISYFMSLLDIIDSYYRIRAYAYLIERDEDKKEFDRLITTV